MAEAKTLKMKRKKWYTILAPGLFRQMEIGEILLDDVRKAVGRVVTANLMELTNDVKKQNMNMKFIIRNIEGERLLTETIGYEVIPASIKRMVRRGRERVDSSIVCVTADNKRIRVKTFLLSRSMITGSVKSSLLRHLNDSLIKSIRKLSYDNLIEELVSHKLQKTMHSQLSKIYPLKACEIRMLKMEKERRASGEEPPQAEEIKEEEPAPQEEEHDEGTEEEKEEDVEEIKTEESEKNAETND